MGKYHSRWKAGCIVGGYLICQLMLCVSLEAASPQLRTLSPRGGQRGTDVTVSIYGQRLGDAKQIMFYSEGFTVSDLEIQNDKKIKVKLTIAPDCRLGEHSLRIRTESGISELQTFWVSQFPNKEEEESNNFFDEAQPIQLNVTVNGRIDKEDVDYFIL